MSNTSYMVHHKTDSAGHGSTDFRRITLKMEHSEAVGKVWIEPEPYGFYLYIEGANVGMDEKEEPVASIDLFPSSHYGQAVEQNVGIVGQLILHDKFRDDSMAYFRLGQTFSVLEFEEGVCSRSNPKRSNASGVTGAVFGYEESLNNHAHANSYQRRKLPDPTPILDVDIKLFDVESSLITGIGYHQDFEILKVKFHDGNEYVYAEVPLRVFAEFLNATSKGRYFLRNIKPTYRYSQVKRGTQ